MLVFNAVPHEGSKVTGIQWWFCPTSVCAAITQDQLMKQIVDHEVPEFLIILC